MTAKRFFPLLLLALLILPGVAQADALTPERAANIKRLLVATGIDTQMADLLMEKVRPDGLAVVMEADHFCMHWRGVKDTDSAMVNSVMRGAFLKDPNLRREFLSLLPRKNT